LLSELQKEKNYLTRLNAEHIEAQELAQEARNHYQALSTDLENRLEKIRQNSGKQERLVQLGTKMAAYIDRYVTRSRKQSINEPLLEDVRKLLAVEKNRIEAAKEKAKAQEKKAVPVRKAGRKPKPENDPQQRHRIREGSSVKLISTKQSGTVEEIAGDQITVSFGFMRMKVNRDKLQWISDSKG
jgi:DNA mismatch repair protein MutS2